MKISHRKIHQELPHRTALAAVRNSVRENSNSGAGGLKPSVWCCRGFPVLVFPLVFRAVSVWTATARNLENSDSSRADATFSGGTIYES